MMIARFKTSLTVFVLFTCLFFAAAPLAFAASPLDQACSQGTAASTSAICKQAASQGTTNPVSGGSNKAGVINKAANIIALVAGIGAIIMILIGGFEYVTGGGSPGGQRAGDPNAVKKAKARIVSALIGLAIVALAWAIVRLISDNVIK